MTTLEFDPETLKKSFARNPFALRHSLVENPLLGLERIAELADSLSDDQVEQNLGDVPEVLPGGGAPKADLTPGEIARGIETNGCWMVMKRIESDPEYKALLDESLDELDPYIGDREGGTRRREAYIFLSAPHSTTPAHFDPEHNLLLQVKGRKTMTVGGFGDAETEQEELERYYGGGNRNIEFVPREPRDFELEPGDGVYVPVHAPHMVRTYDAVSVSLSITFYTDQTLRRADAWTVNARMRRVGLSPRRPGDRPASDRAKAAAWGALRAAGRPVKALRTRGS